PHRDFRSRPQGKPVRIPASPRHAGEQGAGRRYRGIHPHAPPGMSLAAPTEPQRWSRRRWLGGAGAATVSLALPRVALAGAPIEEPLMAAGRPALTSPTHNTAPPIPNFDDIETRLAYLRWLGAMSERLRQK